MRFYPPRAGPDGGRVFALGEFPADLIRYDTARKAWVPYFNGQSALGLEFSPDGKHAIYIHSSDFTLWRARSNGTEARQLTGPPLHVSGAAWSPDARWIALRGKTPGMEDKVYILRSDGGDPKAIDPRNVQQGIPTWSSDGKLLAFSDVPDVHGRPTGSEVISLFDVERKQTTTLDGSSGLWTARWSPDGRWLAALVIADGSLRIREVNRGTWLAIEVSHIDDLKWSRDSRYIWCMPHGSDPYRRVRVSGDRVSDWKVEPVVGMPHGGGPWSGLTLNDDLLVLRRRQDMFAIELARR